MTKSIPHDPETGEIFEPRFRSAYSSPAPRRPLTFDPALGRTKQEFKDQCDVNRIVANFTKTGRLEDLSAAKGMFLDLVATPQSYQESLNLVLHARDAFEALPADIRNLFGNDVQAFMHAAANDPEALFDVLKPLQGDDADLATVLAAASSKATPEPSGGDTPPLNEPPKA